LTEIGDSLVRRVHSMPFGAEVLPGGGVRFRLWAPDARKVDLCLSGAAGGERVLAMKPFGRGWYEVTSGEAFPGNLYQYAIDGALRVPDPASRCQAEDVHGQSEIVEPASFGWEDALWRGRPWEEAVIYEFHVGTFTPEGTFAAVSTRLDYLVELGVTAIELMPVADFPGRRNWGYDGVLPFAPDRAYGRPEDLKSLIQAAHGNGLMVFLDVVYNHFGPEGNYLHVYAKPFFNASRQTPWGAAINFDGEDSRTVRDFFIHNALYWLEEFHLDGLRFDSVHAIWDDSRPEILNELADAVRCGPGADRQIHLVLENDNNAAHYLNRDEQNVARGYCAQWNDDIHHVLHVMLTGETGGYYVDYAPAPVRYLTRCLTEGFAYQGEVSGYRDGARRGESSVHLPPTAFVSFLQNHDQTGNRAFGERIASLADRQALRAAAALLLLAPSPPLLFMGEELGSLQPFFFFCDFGDDLGQKVTEGRRREFAKFREFRDPSARERIPDPNALDTFSRSVIDWGLVQQPLHSSWLAFYRGLLRLRQREIVPRLRGVRGGQSDCRVFGDSGFSATWILGDGSVLTVLVNLGDEAINGVRRPGEPLLFETPGGVVETLSEGVLAPWSVVWMLKPHAAKGAI
jgi:maltooligosyltrehalose trehalohydrolase